jgi:hypothetical protein
MILVEYLIDKGIITKEDLANALYEQKKNRIPLGQLALQTGMISPQQLFHLLSGQRKRGKDAPSFGQFAIELGILTEKDIESLLKLQFQSGDLLGDVLVSIGVLKKAELFHALRDYRKINTD